MAQADNDRSNLLSEEENQIVFTVIGQRRQSKATTVVQMFHAHPDSSRWTKFRTGVVCMVKDNTQRSYYIRLIDISARKVIFEQELYDQFTYNEDRPHFHSFPGDKFMIGLNFADAKEAAKFKGAVESKIGYVRRSTIRRSKPPAEQQPSSRAPPTAAINRPPVTNTRSDPYSLGDNKKKPQAPVKGRKLTKADIGLPTDFKHLAHVGWDPNTGAFNSNNINPDWKNLLDKVGVTEEQLQDKDTAKFIYDFVEKNGGIQEATRQLTNQRPPPPPANRGAPPPPPPSRGGGGGGGRGPPPPPHRSSPSGPPPPPPHSRGSSSGGGGGGGGSGPGAPPPPPPPPPPIGGPPPPPSAGGGASKGGPPPPPPSTSKPSSSLPPVSDGRGDLLASIRNPGFKLKKVSDSDPRASIAPPDEGAGQLDGMAGALQRALQQRAKVIQDDSDHDSDDEFDEDEEDWDP